ncbi:MULTISPECIES: hypothetical protein [Hoeflea]|jgi:hypothetical protein|uniref:Uncharacterized protein n=1 Tax=Hoeflea alexandrii TaxID=288436 RepID=A0ABT1CLU3_9HYPH|nr:MULTISPECIES: hypothetical protein [Hoeflea]MBV6652097.1 hypothetical protein [Hoeflea sp.]MCO6407155.1 hypothetical protein [Hoeflea alexandrii]MCY0154419.1 hypothetical protein [Hoeflea alexandrii]
MLNSPLTMPIIELFGRWLCGHPNPGKQDVIARRPARMFPRVFDPTGDSHKKPIRQGFTGKKRLDPAINAILPAFSVSPPDNPI